MTVRMDSVLKTKFDALCSQFGMSANTAMNVFANAVVLTKSIPFEIRAAKTEAAEDEGINAFRKIRAMAEAGELPDLTMDEINEEISRYRKGL